MIQFAQHLRRIKARTYCEIGMNQGLGTVAALSVHPEMHVHTFDFLEWMYTPKVVEFIALLFPGRQHVHPGSSFETLPAFAAGEGKRLCDAALIDGDHREAGVKRDIENMRGAMRCDHVLFLDDIESEDKGAGLALRKAVKAGTLEILHKQDFPARGDNACMRMYTFNKKRALKRPLMLRSVAEVQKAYDLEWACPNGDVGWSFAIARYKNLPGCPS